MNLIINLTIKIFFCILFLFAGNKSMYAQEYVQEKIFVHTDKNYFHAGELVRYSVYVVNAEDNKLIGLSSAAYIELLDSLNKPVHRNVVALKNGRGSGSFIIPPVVPGVFRFRAYTNWMKNFAAENYYHKEIAIVNAQVSNKTFVFENTGTVNGPSLTVNADKKIYNTRSNVRITVNMMDTVNTLDFSISVYRIDSFSRIDPSHIGDLQKNNDGKLNGDIRYLPEVGERIVTGNVIEKNTGNAAKGTTVYLSVPGSSSGFSNTVTDSSGNFKLAIREVAPSDIVSVQTDITEDKIYTIQVNSPYSSEFISESFHDFSVAKSDNILSEQSISAQVEQSYNIERYSSYQPVVRDTVPFYGRADFVYHLDEYVRFSKMEEVFREFIGPVAVSKRGNSYQLAVYELQTHNTFPSPPLVLLDGYPVVNIDKLFSFDPLKVKTIEVLNRKYIRGSMIFNGIINIITYSRDMNGYPPDQHATLLSDQVIPRERNFDAPDYNHPEVLKSRKPDFRNVLYWSPQLRSDSTGRKEITFYTSDLDGRYVVIVQGIAADGSMKKGIAEFEVVKSNQLP